MAEREVVKTDPNNEFPFHVTAVLSFLECFITELFATVFILILIKVILLLANTCRLPGASL